MNTATPEAQDQPVTHAIQRALPKTLSITALGFLIGVVIAVPLGMLAALRRGSIFDFLASSSTFVGISLPTFWFGIVFILIFAVKLNWLPSVGYVSPSDGLWPWFEHLIPSAENIAVVCWRQLCPALPQGLALRVRLWETPRNYVEYDGS